MNGLNDFLAFPLEQIPFVFLALVIAFTFHEFAHAYSAYKFGDPTAKQLGRVTLNPRVHLDVFGTLLIFLAGFGWAKPVPVNRERFKYPRLMGVIVSAAGPFSNLLVAFAAMALVYALTQFGIFKGMSVGMYEAVRLFFKIIISLNILLFLFNLIPLPPLDGYRILEDLAPRHVRAKMTQYEQWGVYIFLLMVFIPPLARVTIDPLFSLSGNIFSMFRGILDSVFGAGINWYRFLQ